MSTERLDFDDGKYTVINDNGTLTALRYGQPWARDLVGDNLVYWMFVEVRNLKEQRDHFQQLAKDNGAVIVRTATELADMKAQRDELQATLDWMKQNHDLVYQFIGASGDGVLDRVRKAMAQEKEGL